MALGLCCLRENNVGEGKMQTFKSLQELCDPTKFKVFLS